jgi:hypothetical protein
VAGVQNSAAAPAAPAAPEKPKGSVARSLFEHFSIRRRFSLF